MGWTKQISNFFTLKDSDTYCAARDKMCQIRENISDVLYVLPDVTVAEMVFVKDKWQDLPNTVGENVKVKALELKANAKTVLTDFGFNSKIFDHGHIKNYEFMYVCDGEITVEINSSEFSLSKGECVMINIGDSHSVMSNGASVLTCYSTNPNTAYLTKNDIENLMNKLQY